MSRESVPVKLRDRRRPSPAAGTHGSDSVTRSLAASVAITGAGSGATWPASVYEDTAATTARPLACSCRQRWSAAVMV